jgi:hypothetical protein
MVLTDMISLQSLSKIFKENYGKGKKKIKTRQNGVKGRSVPCTLHQKAILLFGVKKEAKNGTCR